MFPLTTKVKPDFLVRPERQQFHSFSNEYIDWKHEHKVIIKEIIICKIFIKSDLIFDTTVIMVWMFYAIAFHCI